MQKNGRTVGVGFVDGNKRVAFASTELFLQLSGLDIKATNRATEQFIYSHLENGTFSKQVIESWLRLNTKRFDF